MAYATTTTVQALNPKRTYSSTSTPTTTQVTSFIDDIAGTINTLLEGKGLTVPVTTPADFVTALTLLNSLGAAALAEQAMFPEQGGPGATPHGAWLWRQYQVGLKELKESPLPSSLRGDDSAASFWTEHPTTEPAPDDNAWRDAKFGKDKVF